MKNKIIQSKQSINKLPAVKKGEAMLSAIKVLKLNAPSKEGIQIGASYDIYARRK